jgi:hypothetical protein
MSNEAIISVQLQVRIGSLNYQSLPPSYYGNISVANGPSPGVVTATPAGTVVAFTQLKVPGYFRIMNLQAVGSPGYVEHGPWNGTDFFPYEELLPGETYVGRFSRNLGQEFIGTASSSTHVGPKEIMVKAHGAGGNIAVLIECFDS